MTDELPPAGFYWVNDPSRYGWEVVQVAASGCVYSCGIEYEARPEEWQQWTFIPIPKPACTTCGGAGSVDSGGFTPWGSPIDIPCPDCSP